jgi:WD40 repeat protein/serine/threonine protein kinase
VVVTPLDKDNGKPPRFSDYELLEEIARGGMGVVYKARQVSLDRIVAVKMLLFGPLASKDYVQRFRVEASAAASLQHPNIVAVHEVGVHQNQHYLVMDYVAGQTLSKLSGGQPLPARAAARYVKTIAEAIHFAHEHGVLHRDLKPSNVLIDLNNEPRVADFGLAKRLDADSDLTLSGQVLGSPNYMSPEQASGRRGKVGRHSDVYSLGAILFHLLTGRPPFVAETVSETIQLVLEREPFTPRGLVAGIPRDLDTICLRCLEKEPAKRYATAQALAAELDRFLKDEPIQARPVGTPEKVWRWCRRKPALAASLAAILLLLLVVLIGAPIAAYRINEARKAQATETRRARRSEYAADMNLALQAVAEGNLFGSQQLLDKHRPRKESALRGWRPESDLRGWEWRYLWRQCRGDERFVLGSHVGGATAVGALPDGKTVWSAGNDGAVRLWNLESRRLIASLPHADRILHAAASPDGRWLATVTASPRGPQPVRLWDLTERREAAVLRTNFFFDRPSLAFSPDNRTLGLMTSQQGLRLWDAALQKEVTSLPSYGNPGFQRGFAFAPASQTLAYGEDEWGEIVLWDMNQRLALGRLAGHSDRVLALSFSPDGKRLASSSVDRSVRLWSVTEQRAVTTFTNFTGVMWGLEYSPDGQVIAAAGWDQRIYLLDGSTGSLLSALQGHSHRVRGLAFTPDSHSLLSVGEDGAVRVWHGRPAPRQAQVLALPGGVRRDWPAYFGRAVCLSPDGRYLLAVLTNDTFRVWDTRNLHEVANSRVPVSQAKWAAVGPEGRICAFAAADGQVVLHDLQTAQSRLFTKLTNAVGGLVFAPGGGQVVLADARFVRVWDVARQVALRDFPNDSDARVHSLAATPGGETVMASLSSGVVKVWGVGIPRKGIALVGHEQAGTGLAMFSGQGTAVTASTDVRLWELSSGKELDKLSPRPSRFSACAVSPDGRRLAVGDRMSFITIWDLGSRQEMATLRGHEDAILLLAFTPDGNTLVSVSPGELRVWSAASFEETEDPLDR